MPWEAYTVSDTEGRYVKREVPHWPCVCATKCAIVMVRSGRSSSDHTLRPGFIIVRTRDRLYLITNALSQENAGVFNKVRRTRCNNRLATGGCCAGAPCIGCSSALKAVVSNFIA
jgi:hypothetical protein